jgi:K+-sensing histidine kinase KdpD
LKPIRCDSRNSNLVDNAVKYTPENGNIFVAVSSEGSDATVAVRDTGIGVPADRAQSIFQPFTQLGDASDMSAGGLGLGLALVRSLTELHGGAVQLVSAGPGKGSCFTVRLPLRSKLRRVEAAAACRAIRRFGAESAISGGDGQYSYVETVHGHRTSAIS